jgi:hypothetical protein
VPSVSELTAGDTNRRARNALVSQIRDRRTILFAGAGFGAPAGFPMWSGLLHGLEDLCDALGPGFARDDQLIVDDPLWYADSIKSHIEGIHGSLEPYWEHLVRVFMQMPRVIGFHEDVVAMPFRGFITTNYEPTIEAALAITEREPADKCVIVTGGPGALIREFHRSLTRDGEPRLVAHIHGYYRQPRSIILSASDYAKAYALNELDGEPPALVDFLRSVLAPWSLVFIGFGFRDQHFEAFLQSASRRFGLWNTDTHFALVDTSAESADSDALRAGKFKSMYGIQTVFYERIGDSHQQLYETVSDMRADLGLGTRSSVSDINERMIEGMRG